MFFVIFRYLMMMLGQVVVDFINKLINVVMDIDFANFHIRRVLTGRIPNLEEFESWVLSNSKLLTKAFSATIDCTIDLKCFIYELVRERFRYVPLQM